MQLGSFCRQSKFHRDVLEFNLSEYQTHTQRPMIAHKAFPARDEHYISPHKKYPLRRVIY
jgi:hypothetical protein